MWHVRTEVKDGETVVKSGLYELMFTSEIKIMVIY